MEDDGVLGRGFNCSRLEEARVHEMWRCIRKE